jgi:signal transduction histidine kinase
MSISDDGDGFDLDQVKHKKGVGLSNITSRAELFNGKVKIDTAPGKGCTLNIYIPISNL